MAFTDWTCELKDDDEDMIIHEFIGYKRLGTFFDAIAPGNIEEQDEPNRTSPIKETGSLQIQALDGTRKGKITRDDFAGVESGYFRTQVDFRTETSGDFAWGIFCYGSQADLCESAGSCYLLSLRWDGAHTTAALLKSVGDGISMDATELVVSDEDIWSQFGIFTVQLTWLARPSGVQLIYSQGAALDFTDLTVQLSYLDTSSPLSVVTGGQGFWGETQAATLNVFQDETGWEAYG